MEGKMKGLTIGQLARKTQVNVETVRFYERKGLLPRPPRRESGYREYPPDAVARLQFIKRAKELGFSLKEILDLFSLRVDPHTSCGDVKKRADHKIADIEEKIRTLQEMKKALTKVVGLCHGVGPTSQCPILDLLDPEKSIKTENWEKKDRRDLDEEE
jgi:MerR family mercuric resistance operon transcriptional regulator